MKIRLSRQQRDFTVKSIFLRTTTGQLFRFLLAMCCVIGRSTAACPSVCDCKWKDGKESVFCANTNLTSLPQRLDAGVLVLHFAGNSLLTLRNDVFQAAGLLNLQKLYLVRCGIKYIEPHAFRALKNLVELDLSYNVFSVVPSLALLPIPDLRELKLNGNPILKIAGYAFAHVRQLVRLEVADCRIGYVDEHAFHGLEHSLEWLRLSRNRLANLRPDAFTVLAALHGLDVSDNPLNCSCELRPLRDWMMARGLAANAWPACRWPEHNANKSWDKLQSDDFACLPTAHAAVKTINAFVGENVTLTCKIGGTPAPNVRWTLRNRVLLNSTFGHPITNKRSYLIHSSSNSYSNLTILSLELQDTGQYVCIAENKAGKVIADIVLNIEKAPLGPILSERVVLIGILLVTVLIVFLCSVILFIRVMYCKHDTQADIESKRRIISEKIEMKRNSANLKRSSSMVPNAKTVVDSNNATKKISDSRLNDRSQEADYSADTPSEDVRKPQRPKDFKEIKSKSNVAEPKSPSSSIFESHIGEIALQHHVLHKKELPSGKLYTTAMAFMTDDAMMNYRPETENSATYSKKKTHYNTMPKNHSYSGGRTKRNISAYPRVSESQSPLLRDKYYGSSSESLYSNAEKLSRVNDYHSQSTNGGYAKSVRRSKDGYWAYPSLPTSPNEDHRYWTHRTNANDGCDAAAVAAAATAAKETPLLNHVPRKSSKNAPSSVNYATYSPHQKTAAPSTTTTTIDSSLASATYDYHAAQLERFLDEYRRLHSELTKMKETCERFGARDVDDSFNLFGSVGGGGVVGSGCSSSSSRYSSLRSRPHHRRSKSSLAERPPPLYDSRASLRRSLSAKSRSFERPPMQSKSCSFERSVSFVPGTATASNAAVAAAVAATTSSLLKDTASKGIISDDVTRPKSILKKKSDSCNAATVSAGADYGYGYQSAAKGYDRSLPYACSTLPLKRTRLRRFSDSSMEGFFD